MNIIFSSESQNGFYFSYQSDVTSYNVMAGTTSKRHFINLSLIASKKLLLSLCIPKFSCGCEDSQVRTH